MSKTRRNAPCPCDSGHKYKHCCGATSDAMRRVPKKMSLDEFPPDVQKQLIEAQRKMAEEQRIYGHARPMLTVEHMGYRFVVVHNRLEHSKSWKTPADFFDDYIKRVMDGSGWGNAEIAKPYEKRHPLLQWYHDVCTWQREHHHERNAEGVFGGVATGSVKAYYSVGYDLWTLDNHVLLQEILIRRLKIADQFQGARYEMYVIAAMIRAGFNVVLEDEKDPSRTHCELTATHRHTGRKFSVEAKSTGRTGFLGKAGNRPDIETIDAKIYRQLQAALLKDADHERIVFIDVNMPPHEGLSFEAPWFKEAANQVGRLEDSQAKDNPYPPAFLFFTNHPYHYVGNEDVEPSSTYIFTGINHPELKAGPEGEDESAAKEMARRFSEKNPEINQLVDSVFNHTRIPTQF